MGFGVGSVIHGNGSEDPDPYQNETDLKHCFINGQYPKMSLQS